MAGVNAVELLPSALNLEVKRLNQVQVNIEYDCDSRKVAKSTCCSQRP